MIEVGKKGRIVSGLKAGGFVYVEDDTENTGGYLVHTATSPDFQDGFDGWVEKEGLEQYFNEAQWEIEWLD
jgi:hypothetical protein